VRSFLGRLARRCLVLLRGRYSRIFCGALLLMAVVGGGLALAGDSATVEAQEYSVYSDPEKPAISFILSDEGNVEEFQTKFGLSDEEMEEVLAAVREENETLAQEYAESERLVESSEGLPNEQIRSKVAASDYDEKVRAAVAETKASIEALLPEERRPELKAWVDAKFVREGKEFSEDFSATYQAAARGVGCRVFATQYIGHTRYEVALPHRTLKRKFLNGNVRRVSIRRDDHRTRAPVKEVGPWNIRDNYWRSRRYRDMWKDLPRCKPEAEAAYFNNYNRGRDQFGRKVLNPAGVDLTPRVARRLGLRRYQNAWVYVRYPWVGR
jgi:hypothetical protein